MSTPEYPLPSALQLEVERHLRDVPDREKTVWLLRRLFGRVYAHGYDDGRMVGMDEALNDERHNRAQGKTS